LEDEAMEAKDNNQQIVVNAGYQIFILLLVIFSIVNSILLVFPFQPQQKLVIRLIDDGICTILLADFFYRLLRARSKRTFLIDYYGWMAFLGSLPFPWLRLLRLIQMAILWRKLRREDYLAMGKVVIERRAQTALFIILFLMVVVLEIGSVWVSSAEANAQRANIKTASDALWWGLVTMATVGYGDYYPVTNQGRIAGVFEMTVGVGIFSVLTSFLANWFRTPKKVMKSETTHLNKASPPGQRARIMEIKRLMDEQEQHYQQTLSELKDRLEEIERGIGTSDG
jgi:magnesium-transporting ATPase (P-type)